MKCPCYGLITTQVNSRITEVVADLADRERVREADARENDARWVAWHTPSPGRGSRLA